MASVSTFALTRFTALASGDVIAAVDISDLSQSANGSLDAITVANFFLNTVDETINDGVRSVIITAALSEYASVSGNVLAIPPVVTGVAVVVMRRKKIRALIESNINTRMSTVINDKLKFLTMS